MKKYDLLVLGFGKAGKTLAKFAAAQGQNVAVVEQSSDMYGGTCINVGCIPSKTLVHEGLAHGMFSRAFSRKHDVVSALNNKNFHNLADDEKIEVFTNKAQFKSDDVVALLDDAGQEVETLTAENIIINTGGKPNILPIKGVDTAKNLYDSTGIMNLAEQPDHLVIIGGGYIALEFASMFANFGTKVTVLEYGDRIMPREDSEITEQAKSDLEDKGVRIVTGVNTESFEDKGNVTVVHTSAGDFEADAVLLATGRVPNTDLGLENTSIKLGQRGEIEVNEHLQTAVPNVFAVGDVKGGLQFTYISLDDFRIVKDFLFGSKQRTTGNRGAVPYTVFIDPPLSRIGMTAEEAADKGIDYKEGKLPVAQMPRHKINNDTRGLFKVVIESETGRVLGATLYGAQSEEIINILKLAIDQNVTYDVLRDNIYTHPTMAENFNDLFNV